MRLNPDIPWAKWLGLLWITGLAVAFLGSL